MANGGPCGAIRVPPPRSSKLQTSVVKKTVNPVWNEDLTLAVLDPSAPIKLVSKAMAKQGRQAPLFAGSESKRAALAGQGVFGGIHSCFYLSHIQLEQLVRSVQGGHARCRHPMLFWRCKADSNDSAPECSSTGACAFPQNQQLRPNGGSAVLKFGETISMTVCGELQYT